MTVVSWILAALVAASVPASSKDDANRAKKLAAAQRCGPALFYWFVSTSSHSHATVDRHIKHCLSLLRHPKQRRTIPSFRLRAWPSLHQTQWIRIPAGNFLMGSNDEEKTWFSHRAPSQRHRIWQESPLHQQRTREFLIARTEVTHMQWTACVRAGRCPTHPGPPNLPIVSVTWIEAQAYCHWVGGNLPTEAQWEKAARGPQVPRNIWPWGKRVCLSCSNGQPGGPNPVATQPCDQSVYGVMDMGANVAEWVLDGKQTRKTGSLALVKGGSWKASSATSRIAFRRWVPSTTRRSDIGFRCVVTSRTRS